jgi:ribosomal-protein-alanine N-acetyltransferase
MGSAPQPQGVTVRPVHLEDFEPLSRLDLTYPTGRYLQLERSGPSPELVFRLAWRTREPGERLYAQYEADWLRRAASRADLFVVAQEVGSPVGLLIAVVPEWTNAGEITDLAVARPMRGRGAGRALVTAAVDWGRERDLRALWVEPRTDNAEAIDFYLRMGFRISGFNDRMYSNEDGQSGQAMMYMHLGL